MRTFKSPFWRKQADATGGLTADDPATSKTAPSMAATATTEARLPVAVERRPTTRIREDARRPLVTADDIYFTTKDAAKYMHFLYSHRSLERMRCEGGGKGPAFVKMPGRKGKILYPKSEIDRWLKSLRTYHSTSEYDT